MATARKKGKKGKSSYDDVTPPLFHYELSGWEDGEKFEKCVDHLDRWATQSANEVKVRIGDHLLAIRQDPHSPHLGGYLWDSSSLFCCYLVASVQSNRLDLKDKICIELGSGVGLVSVLLSRLGVHKIIMTDIPELVPVMDANLEYNRENSGASTLSIQNDSLFTAPLFWGDKQAADKIIEEHVNPHQTHPDFLFAVDCIYSEASATGLVESMDHLSSTNTVIYCISEQRNAEAQESFIRESRKLFHFQVIPKEEWFPFVPPKLREDHLNFYMLRKNPT